MPNRLETTSSQPHHALQTNPPGFRHRGPRFFTFTGQCPYALSDIPDGDILGSRYGASVTPADGCRSDYAGTAKSVIVGDRDSGHIWSNSTSATTATRILSLVCLLVVACLSMALVLLRWLRGSREVIWSCRRSRVGVERR